MLIKRGEAVTEGGLRNIKRKLWKELKGERVIWCFSFPFFNCCSPIPREGNLYVTALHICNPILIISCLSFPLWSFHPVLVINKLCQLVIQKIPLFRINSAFLLCIRPLHLPLTIDLIFLLEIKLLRGETGKKKLIKVSSFFLFLGGLGFGVILSTRLYICCINLNMYLWSQYHRYPF